jgi:hypothetical protein
MVAGAQEGAFPANEFLAGFPSSDLCATPYLMMRHESLVVCR